MLTCPECGHQEFRSLPTCPRCGTSLPHKTLLELPLAASPLRPDTLVGGFTDDLDTEDDAYDAQEIPTVQDRNPVSARLEEAAAVVQSSLNRSQPALRAIAAEPDPTDAPDHPAMHLGLRPAGPTPDLRTHTQPGPAHGVACSACGATGLLDARFCGSCGAPLDPTMRGGPTRTALEVIRGFPAPGHLWPLGDQLLCGRGDVELQIAGDPCLSKLHARFFHANGQLHVEDLNSLNGVFVRVHDPVAIDVGARFTIGQQLFGILLWPPPDRLPQRADQEGTLLLGSPDVLPALAITRIYATGDRDTYLRTGAVVLFGREVGDIDVPEDEYLSMRHTRLRRDQAGLVLEDLGSRNGTFLAITEPTPLKLGDEIQLGSQHLRVVPAA